MVQLIVSAYTSAHCRVSRRTHHIGLRSKHLDALQHKISTILQTQHIIKTYPEGIKISPDR